MRRLLVAILATLSLGIVAVPASADPLYSDYSHHNCPNGVHVNLGGGPGWRHYMRRAVDGWNLYVAPNYSAAPRITRVTYWGGWNSHVLYGRCFIDMDEWRSSSSWGHARVVSSGGHIAGATIFLYSDAWQETGRYGWRAHFLRDYITAHELQHTMGLGHNPYCDSVMSYCYDTLAHNGRDRHTLAVMYNHRHG